MSAARSAFDSRQKKPPMNSGSGSLSVAFRLRFSSQSLTCGTDSERAFARMKVLFEMVQQAQRRRCTIQGPQSWQCRARSASVPQVVTTEKCYVHADY